MFLTVLYTVPLCISTYAPSNKSFHIITPITSLKVDEGKILFKTTTGKANDVPKEALLNESDHLWTELRYDHIAKVIQVIKDRMSDIIQNSAVAKRGTEEQTITAMAAAVRELPEYQQTMNKLGQHVAIAQQVGVRIYLLNLYHELPVHLFKLSFLQFIE